MEPNSFGLRLSGCRRLVFILFVLGIPGLPLGPSLWAQEDDGDNPQSRDHGITEIVARIWTDKENQQVNAIFRAQQGNRVKVEKYNGEIVSFSYDALIPEDQQYLDEVVEKFGAAPGVRTWTDTSGNRFRGFFLTIDKSEIEFLLLSEEKIIRVESIFISQSDIDHILRDLDKYRSRRRVHYPYRSWSYRDVHGNQLMSLGKYKELAGENLVLTQRGEVHRIPLSRLS
ncbi:MAG: hypothetical protein VX438_18215, partial [Planctomycetota bacterium]|nr:hypothetical protein [Planctomycetota bacterium]